MTSTLTTLLGFALILMFLWDGYDAYKECPSHYNVFDKAVKAVKEIIKQVIAFGFASIGFLGAFLVFYFLFTH